jgi:hypothetical protein
MLVYLSGQSHLLWSGSSVLISMLGDLLLMRILVGEAHVPVLVFLLGNSWVFAGDALARAEALLDETTAS